MCRRGACPLATLAVAGSHATSRAVKFRLPFAPMGLAPSRPLRSPVATQHPVPSSSGFRSRLWGLPPRDPCGRRDPCPLATQTARREPRNIPCRQVPASVRAYGACPLATLAVAFPPHAHYTLNFTILHLFLFIFHVYYLYLFVICKFIVCKRSYFFIALP